MIWVAVFPTLTALNLVLGDWLGGLDPVLRTFVLATVAVPIVIYGLMPQLHRLRVRILVAHCADHAPGSWRVRAMSSATATSLRLELDDTRRR